MPPRPAPPPSRRVHGRHEPLDDAERALSMTLARGARQFARAALGGGAGAPVQRCGRSSARRTHRVGHDVVLRRARLPVVDPDHKHWRGEGGGVGAPQPTAAAFTHPAHTLTGRVVLGRGEMMTSWRRQQCARTPSCSRRGGHAEETMCVREGARAAPLAPSRRRRRSRACR